MAKFKEKDQSRMNRNFLSGSGISTEKQSAMGTQQAILLHLLKILNKEGDKTQVKSHICQ